MRHAELTGWPQGDDEDAKLQRIDIATISQTPRCMLPGRDPAEILVRASRHIVVL